MAATSDDDRILNALCAIGRPENRSVLQRVQQPGAWLITVVATWGSSPRPAGSLLLIDAAGRETGSVSGGCVEADLVERCQRGEFDGDRFRLISYGADAAEAERFGLPCGGRLDLVVERVLRAEPWQRLAAQVAARGIVLRRLCLDTAEASLHTNPPADTPDFAFEQRTVARLFGPRWQLIIIGAVHITEHLAPIAHALGYRVVVCDPRRERLADLAAASGQAVVDLAGESHLPSGIVLDPRMPDDCARALADDPRSAVVTLTHDPKLDDMALMEALTSAAFYVGALGSRRSQQSRRARLAGLGLPARAIDRLHGPVGLDLGGRTPAEIAVSIAAQLIACRHVVSPRQP